MSELTPPSPLSPLPEPTLSTPPASAEEPAAPAGAPGSPDPAVRTPAGDRDDDPPPSAPRLICRLIRSGALPETFAPLALPEIAELQTVGVDGDVVDHLHAEMSLSLRTGRYHVPVSEDEALGVEVSPETTCEIWVSANRGLDPEQRGTLVSAAELSFSPGIRLQNVWPVLGRLPTLFEDHDLALLRTQVDRLAHSPSTDSALQLGRTLVSQAEAQLGAVTEDERLAPLLANARSRLTAGARRLWRELQVGAGLVQEELKHRSQQLPQVVLRHVSARPVKRRGGWQLQLRFSGEIGYPGALTTRFTEVVLPTSVLPAPAATLSALLSDDPLATAHLRADRVPFSRVLRALAALPGALQGHLELQLTPPSLEVGLPTPTLGEMNMELSLPAATRVRASFSGEVSDERVSLQVAPLEVGTAEARLGAELELEVRARASSPAGEAVDAPSAPFSPQPVMAVLVEAAQQQRWPADRLALRTTVTLDPRSALQDVGLFTSLRHPLADEGSGLRLALRRLGLAGSLTLDTQQPAGTSLVESAELTYDARLELPDGSHLDDGVVTVLPRLGEGRLEGRVTRTDEGGVVVQVDGGAHLALEGITEVEDFPELHIHRGEATLRAAGELEFWGRVRTGPITGRALTADFSGSRGSVTLQEALLRIGERAVSLPAGSRLSGEVAKAHLSSSGLGQGRFDVAWDLQGQSPVLEAPGHRVEIFVPELRQGQLEVALSPVGGVSISGRRGGLYDAHFFNALINPGAELERWLQILDDDDAMDKVLSTLRVFSGEAYRLLDAVQGFVKRARGILDGLGIQQPGDFISARTIAQVLSRVLSDDDSLVAEIHPLVKQVTDGEGLDVSRVKALLGRHLPEHDYDYEVDRGLRLAARMLAPTEPVPPHRRLTVRPLVEQEEHAAALAPYPSAAALYEGLAGVEPGSAEPGSAEPGSAEWSALVARIAPYLTLEQVDHLLGRPGAGFRPQDRHWLQAVAAVKRRCREIAESYGGIAFLPQAWAISFFLGEAVRTHRDDPADPGPNEERGDPQPNGYSLGSGLLGPQEVGILLQSGLASLWKGGPVQINQRLLIDYVRRQPPEFLREVLVELSGRSPRVLTGVLYALLRLEQGRLREPLDLDEWIGSTLGVPVPDLEDYMAGGRWARESHYQALSRTAELILAEAEPYFALREHLQSARHPVPPPIEPATEGPCRNELVSAGRRGAALARTEERGNLSDSERRGTPPARMDRRPNAEVILARALSRAQRAIEEADRAGHRCLRGAKGGKAAAGPAVAKQREAAAAAYEEAFAACRALRDVEPAAFTRDGFKAFWSRNHEALVVRSVVRNVQQDVDDVRAWLAARSGGEVPESEQALVDAVIDAVYWDEADRQRLRGDPLVRLLLDPPAGHYDFTIISAMGVITEGARGTELKDAYARLEAQRGVRTIRADTQTARSLDFNAGRIEEAARRSRTPWGYIGYSQGCANGLQAESRLLGGTPDQQALAARLVTRNLLFSAANGSAHGTCGDWKFLRAMIDLDRFLKHYQAVFSNKMIRLALSNIGLLLDSRPFVHSLGGVDSLSFAGLTALARDGQWKADVPTSILRGVVEPETLPEALEMLSNVLSHQIESTDHDTQVTITEALGHPVWIKSPMAEVLERCDMGCCVQRTHHWSPLKYATDFVTTPRDRELMIYDFPKDRHVFPWVEVNARFGVIGVRDPES